MKNDQILNIAIIEDDQFYATLLRSLLSSKLGFNFVTFNCGESFLNENVSFYDIVILDLNLECVGNMPLSGRNILRILDEKEVDIKVIVLTSEDEIESAVEVLKSGAVDYIVKNDEAVDRLVASINSIKDFNKITNSIDKDSEIEKKTRRSFVMKFLIFFGVVIVSILMLSR